MRSIATFDTVALPSFARFASTIAAPSHIAGLKPVKFACQWRVACVCKVQETLWSAEDTGTLLMQKTSFGEVVPPHSLKFGGGVSS